VQNPADGASAYDEWPDDGDAAAATPPPLPMAGDPADVPLAGEADAALPLAQRAPRFCGSCGSPWQTHWSQCEPCAAVAARTSGTDTLPGLPGEPDGIIRVRSAVALYFSLLAVSVVATIAMLADAPTVSTELAATIAMSVVIVLWCAKSQPAAIVRLFKPARPVWFLVAVVAACGSLAVAFGMMETLHRVLHVEKLGYAKPYQDAGYGLWVAFIAICVQPAVFEELAFRGVVLSSLRPTLSDLEAVVVSAMLFMTLHITPAAFPHTLAMGLAAGFIRLRSGSLLPCMLLHFVHNSAVIGAEIYLGI
jgi:membrane protease YdiL (CAAX protease family)